MKNSRGSVFVLLMLSAGLVWIQTLPVHYWPDNERWRLPLAWLLEVDAAFAPLGWQEWRDHRAASRVVSLPPRR
ncbi:MAG: hypothetical protein ACRCWL_10340 [Aeromonas sp.]